MAAGSLDVTALNKIYDSLLVSYQDDAAKYARNPTMATILRHCIETAPFVAGQRITFSGFGQSNYRSREVGEALRTLQRAMLIHLLYPSTSVEIPIMPDLKKAPRLQFVDTVVVALEDRRGKLPLPELLRCKLDGRRVKEAASFYEMLTGQIPVRMLNPTRHHPHLCCH